MFASNIAGVVADDHDIGKASARPDEKNLSASTPAHPYPAAFALPWRLALGGEVTWRGGYPTPAAAMLISVAAVLILFLTVLGVVSFASDWWRSSTSASVARVLHGRENGRSSGSTDELVGAMNIDEDREEWQAMPT